MWWIGEFMASTTVPAHVLYGSAHEHAGLSSHEYAVDKGKTHSRWKKKQKTKNARYIVIVLHGAETKEHAKLD